MSARNPRTASRSLVGVDVWGYADAVRLSPDLQTQRSMALTWFFTAPAVALFTALAGGNDDVARRHLSRQRRHHWIRTARSALRQMEV